MKGKPYKIQVPVNYVKFTKRRKRAFAANKASPSETISKCIEPTQRGPYKNGNLYTPQHVLLKYKEEGLADVQLKVREIYDRPHWNSQLKEACFEKLKYNLRDLLLHDENMSSTSMAICNSLSSLGLSSSIYITLQIKNKNKKLFKYNFNRINI